MFIVSLLQRFRNGSLDHKTVNISQQTNPQLPNCVERKSHHKNKSFLLLRTDIMTEQEQVQETPELLATSLEAFAKELETLQDCPDLRQAQKKCPQIANDKDFHLLFLRTEVFHVDQAAKRYAKYWKDRAELWQEKAFQELSIDQEDAVEASYGFIGTVDQQERIIYLAVGRLNKDRDVDSLCRVCLVTSLEALRKSTALQQKGAVVLMDFHCCTGYDKAFYERYGQVTQDSFPLRVSLVGIVRPLPAMGLIVDMIKLFLKRKLRNRIHVIRNDAALQKHTTIDSVNGLLTRVSTPARLVAAKA